MAAFLRAFSKGANKDEAARQAFGVSLDHLEHEWKDSLAETALPTVLDPLPFPGGSFRTSLVWQVGATLCCVGVALLSDVAVLVLRCSRRGLA